MDISTRAALTFGLTASGLVAGTNTAMSIFAVPPMLLAPKQVMVQQWRKLFNLGLVWVPPTAVLASASLGYVAYASRSASKRDFGDVGGDASRWKGIAFAAAGILSIVPYTLMFMKPTNDKLIAESNGAGHLAEREVKALIEWWSRLNLVRGVIGATGTAMGIWSAVGLR
ncbi:MAG: hypothetical protein OHK93_004573 [Ramalina farinacea]|uniref:DUF1772-domain-containing protein n=1 Tax=Ramalina farinacea TaxID=258253 RepID=A0AA43QUF6_9LECA|nr:hypothetical protein [Ramalina farinacea]